MDVSFGLPTRRYVDLQTLHNGSRSCRLAMPKSQIFRQKNKKSGIPHEVSTLKGQNSDSCRESENIIILFKKVKKVNVLCPGSVKMSGMFQRNVNC